MTRAIWLPYPTRLSKRRDCLLLFFKKGACVCFVCPSEPFLNGLAFKHSNPHILFLTARLSVLPESGLDFHVTMNQT
jgi:hypothetical protein